MLVTLHELAESLLVILGHLGYFAVKLRAEKLLQLLFFLCHLQLMLFERVGKSTSAKLYFLGFFRQLCFKFDDEAVQICDSVVETLRLRPCLSQVALDFGAFALQLRQLFDFCLDFSLPLIFHLLNLASQSFSLRGDCQEFILALVLSFSYLVELLKH